HAGLLQLPATLIYSSTHREKWQADFSALCLSLSTASTCSLAQFSQKLFKVFRKGSFKFHIFSSGRMYKPQHHRMQSLPLQMKGIFPPAVDLIPQKRVSDAGHMHADLMGSARLQTALDIRIGAEALQHPVMGDGTLSSGADYSHFFPLYGMAPDGRVYPS